MGVRFIERGRGPVGAAPPRFDAGLEVEPQRELYLPVRAEADGALDGLAQQAEGRACGRLREALAGLHAAAERSC